jgi:hypothetical protein
MIVKQSRTTIVLGLLDPERKRTSILWNIGQ